MQKLYQQTQQIDSIHCLRDGNYDAPGTTLFDRCVMLFECCASTADSQRFANDCASKACEQGVFTKYVVFRSLEAIIDYCLLFFEH